MSENEAPTPTPEAPPPPPPPAPPQPAAAGGGGADSSNRTLMLVLSYLGPLALIPFLMEKNDQEVQWHAKHGLVLFGSALVLQFVAAVIWRLPWMGCVGGAFWGLVNLGYLVVFVLCIIKALDGKRFLIPGLSDFADKF